MSDGQFAVRLNEYAQRNRTVIRSFPLFSVRDPVANAFQYRVRCECGGESAEAEGINQQHAKNKAAEELCYKLRICVRPSEHSPSPSSSVTKSQHLSTILSAAPSQVVIPVVPPVSASANIGKHPVAALSTLRPNFIAPTLVPAKNTLKTANDGSPAVSSKTLDYISMLEFHSRDSKLHKAEYKDECMAGPSNARTFTQRCTYNGVTALGSGLTKQRAKHQAAEMVCKNLGIYKRSPLHAHAVETSSFAFTAAAISPATKCENAAFAVKRIAPAASVTVAPAVQSNQKRSRSLTASKLPVTVPKIAEVTPPTHTPVIVQSSYKLHPDLYAELSTRAQSMLEIFRGRATINDILAVFGTTATGLVQALARKCSVELQQSLLRSANGSMEAKCSEVINLNNKSDLPPSKVNAISDDDDADVCPLPSSRSALPTADDSDNVAVILTLTTNPKIVYTGFGRDKIEAWEDACRQILLHIKAMKCSFAGDPFDPLDE